MKFKGTEYILCILGLVVVIATYALAFYHANSPFAIMIGLFSSILGAFMVPFGFWGADFAFGVAIGHIKQTEDSRVYVPFLRNCTPLEWWNLNWFIVSVGVALLSLGTFVVGYSLAGLAP
jgi:predicted Na+-dependent transporter